MSESREALERQLSEIAEDSTSEAIRNAAHDMTQPLSPQSRMRGRSVVSRWISLRKAWLACGCEACSGEECLECPRLRELRRAHVLLCKQTRIWEEEIRAESDIHLAIQRARP